MRRTRVRHVCGCEFLYWCDSCCSYSGDYRAVDGPFEGCQYPETHYYLRRWRRAVQGERCAEHQALRHPDSGAVTPDLETEPPPKYLLTDAVFVDRRDQIIEDARTDLRYLRSQESSTPPYYSELSKADWKRRYQRAIRFAEDLLKYYEGLTAEAFERRDTG